MSPVPSSRLRRAPLLAAVVALLAPSLGAATPSFPEALRDTLGLPATPDCALCHRGTPNFDTAVTPFAQAMKAHGLQAYSVSSLQNALEALRTEAIDTDADGITDIDELVAGSDPNGGTLAAAPEPAYGCGGGGTVLAFLPLVFVRRRRRHRRPAGRRLPIALVGITMLVGLRAEAAPTKQRIVLDVQGPSTVLLRKTLYRALSRLGFEVVFSPAGALPARPGPRRLRQLARSRGTSVVFLARIDRGKSRTVQVSLFGAGHWRRPLTLSWRAGALGGLRRIPRGRLSQLAAGLASLRPPPGRPADAPAATPFAPLPGDADAADTDADAPENGEPVAVVPESEPDLQDEDAGEDEATGPVALEVAVGARGFSRRLALTPPPGQAPTRYFLPLGPAALVSVDWFPGAHFVHSAWAHVGLTAGVESGFALRSALGASVFPTDALALHIGVKGRVPLGAFTLLASATYATRTFRFLPSLGTLQPAPLPDVGYRGPRFGVEGRVALGERFSLRFGAAYQAIFTSGTLSSASYFPGLRADAIDANVSGVVSLIPGWSLKAGVDASHHFLRMTKLPDGSAFDGRGLDQSFGVSLALLFLFT